MSFPDVDQRPAKKRRFFADDSPVVDQSLYGTPSLPDKIHPLPTTSPNTITTEISTNGHTPSSSPTNGSSHGNDVSEVQKGKEEFDAEVFISFVGKSVSADAIQRLQAIAGGDMERAVNMYLDGSWSNAQAPRQLAAPTKIKPAFRSNPRDKAIAREVQTDGRLEAPSPKLSKQLSSMPDHRYVGAFGVGAWATTSGANLIKHGESVNIERTKIKLAMKVGRGGKAIQPAKLAASRMRSDIIVRFTNAQGQEVGRLPKETAAWVSTLLDQKVCHLQGICVYAPERLRINDTIYLQLRCSLLKRAFEAGGFVKPQDNNRITGIFEEKETSEEKDLRLRQVALVKLFDEINLHPSTINEMTAKHKRQGLLQAAEIAEQYDKDDNSKKSKARPDEGSTPPADDEAEDGQELEQDQLDSLYKKAQSFDFDTPVREPADTFAMDLRKYQKQALHWMISKEKDEKSDSKERSMHPLWEEYTWPDKDVDEHEMPIVTDQYSFYVNPYSGELSLDFPVQEQHCLGGILADGRMMLIPHHFGLC